MTRKWKKVEGNGIAPPGLRYFRIFRPDIQSKWIWTYIVHWSELDLFV